MRELIIFLIDEREENFEYEIILVMESMRLSKRLNFPQLTNANITPMIANTTEIIQ